MGKWQCPNCFQGNDQLKPINHLDSISKRARTKIVTAKTKDVANPLNLDKISRIFGGKLISKKRSSSKGKSISTVGVKFFEKKPLSSPVDETCSNKPSDTNLGSSMEGTSSYADADEKKSNVSPTVSPMDRKSTSPAKEVLSPSKMTNSEANDEHLEEKPDLSLNKMPIRKTLVLGISAGGEEVRKRKHKVVSNNASQKKRRTEKRKFYVNTPIKCKSGDNKVHKKQKSVTHSISASVSKEDVGNKNFDVEQKDEVLVLLYNFLLDFILRTLIFDLFTS